MQEINSKKIVCQLDENNVYVGPIEADESPLEHGVYLIPRLAIDSEPPTLTDGQIAVWNGESFDINDIVNTTEDEPELTEEDVLKQTLSEYDIKLSQFFNAKAKEKNYDNRITCSLRAGYPGPFQAEGLAFAQWMDACNAYCYKVIQDIQEGTRTVPSFEELSSEFPALVW